MNFTEPIEIPRGMHYGNNYYAAYSNKIHRECHFFSTLEYYNFLTLEINPFVERFCEQPLKIEIIQELERIRTREKTHQCLNYSLNNSLTQ